MACVSEQSGASFDVSMAIAEFVADPSRLSLELPRMTTGQRKVAKRTVDGYPGLKCESFGFGQDRQLHIFKVAVGDMERKAAQDLCVPNAVSIKNTFIDDWTAAMEGDEVLEPVAFRSVPSKLSTKVVKPCISSDCSTVASSPPPGSPTSSVASFQEKPLLAAFRPPPGLEIRNTFLHFGGPPTAERAVQSMPHGMFGHCLAEEASLRTESKRAVEAVVVPDDSVHVPSVSAPLAKGTEVIIDGLVKSPAFNGVRVAVDSFDESTGRYSVLFAAPVAGCKSAKVKRENLLLVCPSAPSFGSALLASDGYPIGEEGFLSTWQAGPIWG